MDTKIKATVYAAKLRTKLKELKAEREKALAAYKEGLVTWKKDLTAWTLKNAKARIESITSTEVKDTAKHAWHRNESVGFKAELFFAGCPAVPTYPDDKQIRDITALLRHLGITGVEEVRISTADVERYLGTGEKIREY